jgi:alpha-galactosidase
VNLARIEIEFRDGTGARRLLGAAHPVGAAEVSATEGGLSLSARFEHSDRGMVASATVANRGAEPVRLDAAWFHVATGFDPSAPARFFKHGYQSWSGSSATAVGGAGAHPRDTAHPIFRINHQSETVRPTEAPEAHTSEMFTVVECEGRDDRVFAGFIGAASALTTMTVRSPERISARAILDGVELAPGSVREIEPLYFTRGRESAARIAARWAAKLGTAMQARTQAPFQRGWCSWYHYFHDISEAAMLANLRALAAMRNEFPIDVVQLDDGFQSALGDWDTTNSKFPGGLARMADEIRAAGFAAGVWTAPFFAARDSQVMREHPPWFIRHESGEPLRAGYNPKWTTSDDPFAYALDPSHPGFRAHLERLFRKLVTEFGFSYLKLDFLYAAAAQGIRYDPNLTRAQTLRRGLEAIRAGAGEDAFILGCGCPLGTAVGVVDGMRVGPDVAPFWGGQGSGDPSTVYALDAIVARSFMHRRLWLNDPDCLMLRARETQLTADERGALATTIAASGGMLLISDDMALLDDEAAALFRAACEIAMEIDSDAARDPVLPIDLMGHGAVRGLVKRAGGETIAMLLNRGDEPCRVSLSSLGLSRSGATVQSLGTPRRAVRGKIELPPHSARIVRIKPRKG